MTVPCCSCKAFTEVQHTKLGPSLCSLCSKGLQSKNLHTLCYPKRALDSTVVLLSVSTNLAVPSDSVFRRRSVAMATSSSSSRSSLESERLDQFVRDANKPLSSPENVSLPAATPTMNSKIMTVAPEGDVAAFPPRESRTSTSRRRPDLPPPPKVGERLKHPDYYAPRQTLPPQRSHQHSHSLQMPLAHPRPWSIEGPINTSSTLPSEADPPVPARSRAKSVVERIGSSTEHPPGYIQDPHASEMTAEQRFATEQEDGTEQGLPLPNCVHSRRQSTVSATLEDSIDSLWRRARKDTESFIDGLQQWLSKTF